MDIRLLVTTRPNYFARKRVVNTTPSCCHSDGVINY